METAVIPLTFTQLLNQGTVFDGCTIAVLLNTQSDTLPHLGLHSPIVLSSLNFSVLQRAQKAVVLNAEDANCLAQRPFLTEQEVVLVSTSATQPEVLEHIENGGRAVWLDTRYNQPFICFYHQQIQTLPLPIQRDFTGTEMVFAAASAWLLNVPLATIYATFAGKISGMSRETSTPRQLP